MDSPLPANVFVLAMFMMLRKSSSSLSVPKFCSLLAQTKKKKTENKNYRNSTIQIQTKLYDSTPIFWNKIKTLVRNKLILSFHFLQKVKRNKNKNYLKLKEWNPKKQSFLACSDKLSWSWSPLSCLLLLLEDDEELSSVPQKYIIKTLLIWPWWIFSSPYRCRSIKLKKHLFTY